MSSFRIVVSLIIGILATLGLKIGFIVTIALIIAKLIGWATIGWLGVFLPLIIPFIAFILAGFIFPSKKEDGRYHE